MLDIQILLAFFGASFLLALAPGPDNIFVLTQSALFGYRAGLATTFGVLTGVLIHTVAVACGVAVLFKTSILAFNILKFLGAAYLCWLAWLAYKSGAQSINNKNTAAFTGYGALYMRGVIMNITNPKVLLFFLAFLPQFCIPGSIPMVWQILILGFLFVIAAFIVFCPVAILGGKLEKKFNSSPKMQIWLNRIAGTVFLGLAGALIFTGQ